MADKIDHVQVKGVTYDVPGSDGSVSSVNGKTGTVVLDADDVGALPDDYVAPVTSVNGMTGDVTVVAGVQSVNGQTGNVTLDADDVGALPDDTVIPQGTVTSVRVQATSPVQSSTDTAQSTSLNTTISLANGYGDTKNPYGSKTANQVLAAPNGSNGAPSFRSLAKADLPTLTASDVGALPSSTSIPSKTSDLTNDSGYITSAQAPVTSVNGMTGDVTVVSGVTSVNGQSGAVVLDADDVGALPDDTSIPSATSDLQNDSGFVSSQQTEKIFVQGTTPSTASDGDIWIDTATQSASGIAYLPLSAGNDHHITGDLYVDEDIIDANGDAYPTKTDLTTTTTGTFSITIKNSSHNVTYRKRNGMVEFGGDFAVDMSGWSHSTNPTIAPADTLPSSIRPFTNLFFSAKVLLNANSWESGTYFPATLQVNTNGSLSLWGNATEMAKGKDVHFYVSYLTATY